MYKTHPVFEKPKDENAKIWRYLDFTKFVSLIDRKSLYFTRLDKLGDPFEGSVSKANIDLRSRFMRELAKKVPRNLLIEIRSAQHVFRRAFRRCAVVNCWHINEFESAAMWKLYLKSEEGVAIQSTFKRLAESIAGYEENDVYIGKVKYIDYENDPIPESNLFYPFVHKRKSFQHEQELRAVIFKFPSKFSTITSNVATFSDGIYVPVNLNTLIEKAFVSPTAENWFGDLVKSIAERYDFKKAITKSNLSDDPIY